MSDALEYNVAKSTLWATILLRDIMAVLSRLLFQVMRLLKTFKRHFVFVNAQI